MSTQDRAARSVALSRSESIGRQRALEAPDGKVGIETDHETVPEVPRPVEEMNMPGMEQVEAPVGEHHL